MITVESPFVKEPAGLEIPGVTKLHVSVRN